MKNRFRNRGNFSLKNFRRRCTLGSGSFGIVVAVTNEITGRSYAMKILQKKRIIEAKQVENTYNEKRVLQSVNSPFLVNMRFFFADPIHLYFILPLALCGEMFNNLIICKRFDEEVARFYAAQVVLALEYLHYMNMIYRDLKPENTVIFSSGYLKLTDFGFCKKITTGRTYTLCGTPEYMAPEIIKNRGYGKAVDWWALGVFIYEMCGGFTPFRADNEKHTYTKILSVTLRYPHSFSKDVRQLIGHLIEPDLTRRYGNLQAGVQDIKQHKWFRDLQWLALFNQKIIPPHIPRVRSLDTDSFGDQIIFQESEANVGKFSSVFKDFY